MDIYFFSRHKPDPQMIKDLGDNITQQFTGGIFDIRNTANTVTFTERIVVKQDAKLILPRTATPTENTVAFTERMGKESLRIFSIPKNSVVVIQDKIVSMEWLKAGVKTLLVSQINMGVKDKNPVYVYTGLVQVNIQSYKKEHGHLLF